MRPLANATVRFNSVANLLLVDHAPIFTSVIPTTDTVNIYTAKNWELRATDAESDAITATLAVKDAAGDPVTASGLTLDVYSTAPYTHKLSYAQDGYTVAAIA